ncbi:MAG: sialate O-acetylesterase, partial [Acidobacteriota bacterium]|nr:sialate O-acetylesterase [Acidobacteriota bacterium]
AATADANGKWMVRIEPQVAGGPHTLEVSGGTERLSVKDILFGDVWLCSGQSNMEWPVKQADNFELEKNNAEFYGIRHFQVAKRVGIVPLRDLESGDWKISSKDTVGDFTAVGFFFAREIHEKLNVPIGLVHSSWGGSEIEPWISREGMLAIPELAEYVRKLPTNWEGADAMLERKIKKKTLGDPDRNPTLEAEKEYLKPGYDFSGWHRGSPMWQWDWQGIWAWRGNGYLARKVVVPESFVGRSTVLGLAESFSYNEVYINGKQHFAGIMRGRREIILPRDAWIEGENTLVLKMEKTIEPEWFGLGFMGSADDVFVSLGDEKIRLANEKWHMMPSFAEPHSYAHLSNNIGTGLYNGMIAPLVPYSFRGVLWYQGESNAGRSYQYRKTFPALINDWRGRWDDDFYFFYVQLSSFGKNQSSNEGSGWAELREAQTLALALPKTGMAVTTDIGNPVDVHPTNKKEVGRRLAANALKKTYGFEVPCSGPMFESVRFEGGQAVVSFKFAESGLVSKGTLLGFEIAGADKVFYDAHARIEGGRVVVWSPNVKDPKTVRYAWSDAPIDANLYNADGFPAVPFRTDDWKGLTEGEKYW